jgi:hypothetical protein
MQPHLAAYSACRRGRLAALPLRSSTSGLLQAGRRPLGCSAVARRSEGRPGEAGSVASAGLMRRAAPPGSLRDLRLPLRLVCRARAPACRLPSSADRARAAAAPGLLLLPVLCGLAPAPLALVLPILVAALALQQSPFLSSGHLACHSIRSVSREEP